MAAAEWRAQRIRRVGRAAAAKARRLESFAARSERHEKRLLAALAAAQAECRDKEQKLLLRALEKKAMSKELHDLMEAMSPDMSESLLAGKSVADMMQDLKDKTMLMHDEDLKRLETMKKQRDAVLDYDIALRRTPRAEIHAPGLIIREID